MAASCPGGSRPAQREKNRLLAFWNQHEIKANHGIFFKTAIALTQVIKRWQTAGRGFDFQDRTDTKGLKCLRKTEEGKENVTVPIYEGEVRCCLQLVCMRNRKPLTSWARFSPLRRSLSRAPDKTTMLRRLHENQKFAQWDGWLAQLGHLPIRVNVSLHFNLARPAGSSKSRRYNQRMRKRCWLGSTFYSLIKVDSGGKVTFLPETGFFHINRTLNSLF